MVYILIPIFNRKEFTLACLQAIAAQQYPAEEIRTVVIDAGSSDGSASAIAAAFPRTLLIHGASTWWWTRCMNEGLRRAVLPHAHAGDFMLALNDDTAFAPDYIRTLVELSRAHGRAIVGSLIKNFFQKDRTEEAGIIANWRTFTFTRRRTLTPEEQKRGYVDETDTLPGRGVLVPIEVFARIGTFAQTLPQSAADYDFFMRAKDAGLRLLVSCNAIVYNKEPLHVSAPRLSFWKTYFSLKSTRCLYVQIIFALRRAPSVWLKITAVLRIFWRMARRS